MRKIAFALAAGLALAVPAALPAESPPAAMEELATPEDWERKLAEAHAELVAARAQADEAHKRYVRARHRNRPRGDALEQLRVSMVESEKTRDELEADWPSLVDQARRGGVPWRVLDQYEDDL